MWRSFLAYRAASVEVLSVFCIDNVWWWQLEDFKAWMHMKLSLTKTRVESKMIEEVTNIVISKRPTKVYLSNRTYEHICRHTYMWLIIVCFCTLRLQRIYLIFILAFTWHKHNKIDQFSSQCCCNMGLNMHGLKTTVTFCPLSWGCYSTSQF